MAKLKEKVEYKVPKDSSIYMQLTRIIDTYLKPEIEKELWSYTTFLSKKEIRPYADAATIEDIKALSDLVLDLQTLRERVLTIYLKMKKAKTRIGLLEKEFLTLPKVKSNYLGLKNQEQRDLFIFTGFKKLAIAKGRRKLFSDMADRIMDMLDKHAGALKNNSYDLKAYARRKNFLDNS